MSWAKQYPLKSPNPAKTTKTNPMTDREEILQLEVLTSEMLQRQDRVNELVRKMRTSQLPHTRMNVQQLDNFEFPPQKPLKDDEWKQCTDEWKKTVDTKLEILQQTLNQIFNRLDQK